MIFALSERVTDKHLSIGKVSEAEHFVFSCLSFKTFGHDSAIPCENRAPILKTGYLVSTLYLKPNPYRLISFWCLSNLLSLYKPPRLKTEFSWNHPFAELRGKFYI